MMVKFKGITITEEMVKKALADFDSKYPDTKSYDNNWLTKKSYDYAIKYKDKLYPPKQILRQITKNKVPLSGGPTTNNVFEKLNFDIIELKDRGTVNYWKIAPGEKARFWNRCVRDKNICVGWEELDDLSSVLDDFNSFKKTYFEAHENEDASKRTRQMNQLWDFLNLKVGDIIVANQGLNKIVGIGRVSGAYEYKADYNDYKHTVRVDWFDVTPRDIPSQARDISKSWGTITLKKLSADEYHKLLSQESVGNLSRELLRRKLQVILYGPPGTGKTFNTRRIALDLIENESGSDIAELYEKYYQERRIEFITFHPSYSYEEFIEGLTVEPVGETNTTGTLQYKLKAGLFKNICKRALGAALQINPEDVTNRAWSSIYSEYLTKRGDVNFGNAPAYVLIVDEINRGDIAKIFGELITLIEKDKRIGSKYELTATLPLSGDRFGVPPNLFIIGTMNTADRSIALLDIALRRRFGFIEMNPDFQVVEEKLSSAGLDDMTHELFIKSIFALKKVNQKISEDKSIGRDKQIGHSFLLGIQTSEDLAIIWKHEILPLLEEYCYGDYLKINSLLFGSANDTAWISQTEGIKNLTVKTINTMIDGILGNEQS